MRTLLLTLSTGIFLSSAAQSETIVNQLDDACVQNKVRACLAAALPKAICEVGGTGGIVYKGDYDIGSPNFLASADYIQRIYTTTVVDGGCALPYVRTSGYSQCSSGGTQVCVLNIGALTDQQLTLFMSDGVFSQCSIAVREVGLFGGKECLKPVSFPDGSFLESGLINALNKIADRIEGIGRRDELDPPEKQK